MLGYSSAIVIIIFSKSYLIFDFVQSINDVSTFINFSQYDLYTMLMSKRISLSVS